jgi:UDP-N-acetylglucosamine:LPS N-acetylglucosamine transferase
MTQGGRRTLLVSSSGGVLLDVLALRPWWRKHDVSWVSVQAPDTAELLAPYAVRWESELRPRQVGELVRAVLRARRMLRSTGIELVVSAGSGVAVPYFLAARLAGVPAVWVETFNVIGKPGLAARLCAALASQVVVQHPELLARHRRAVNVGELY